jgi:S-adenosyl-L-methionine hydrolase (adenosine-forming)
MALITLTSDFGLQDYIAGAVKGQLLQIESSFRIHDISHQIAPFNYPQAVYICRNAIWQFPENTYHLILVNLFEQKPENLLMTCVNGQYIFCADNGLLPMILPHKTEQIVGLPLDRNEIKNTLYCTRQIGLTIRSLEEGASLESLGNPEISYIQKNDLRPLLGDTYIEGQIIFIDKFENVIVNITRDEFEAQRKGRSFRIVFKRNEIIERISESYADVAQGEKLAIFNSANYLEVAINKGNAAGLFGLQDFTDQSLQQHLFYQTVRVYFEE